MVQAKKIVLAKRYDGMPSTDNYRLEEETLPDLKDGEILLEAVYMSIDAGMRFYSERLKVGDTMLGAQIAKIVGSKHSHFVVGAHMWGLFGWRTHTIFNPKHTEGMMLKPYILPSLGDLPLSLGLGHLGMPGVTAYFGLLKVCEPKSGEVVVVSGAAGGVGSIVGQIAKIKGCKAIGIAGSDEKCEWLVKEIGFDHAINYKTENISDALRKYAPNGVDCYFDNVGGEISSMVIHQMRDFGRIAICGCVSVVNSISDLPKLPILQPVFNLKQLRMEGFHVKRLENDSWFDAIAQMRQWTKEGRLKYRETVTKGFENTPQAFIDVLEGRNTGKGVVEI